MTEQTLQIAGMSCAACQHHVERALRTVPGVDAASVNLLANSARISATADLDPAALIQAVRHAGYDATLPTEIKSAPASATTEQKEPRERALGLRALLSLI